MPALLALLALLALWPSPPPASPPATYWPFQNLSSRFVFASNRDSTPLLISARCCAALAWSDERQSENQGTIDVKNVAPTMLPSMTGTMFAVSMSPHPTAAPEKIPNGMKNMFATECSNPKVTKVVIGIHMAAIFPPAVRAANAMVMATLTSQLAQTPFTNASAKGIEVFLTASAAAHACVGSVLKQYLLATAAIATEPIKLPAAETDQILANVLPCMLRSGCVKNGNA